MLHPSRIATTLTLALAASAAHAAGGFDFSHLWTFNHAAVNNSGAMGAEIVAFDSVNNRLRVAGTDANEADAGLGGIDILDLSADSCTVSVRGRNFHKQWRPVLRDRKRR